MMQIQWLKQRASKLSRVQINGFLAALVFTLSTALTACGRDGAAAPPDRRSGTGADEDIPSVLATIGDEKVTLADVNARIGDDLEKLDMQYRRARYSAINSELQTILRERVIKAEAEKQGKTLEQLAEADLGKPIVPSDVEVSAWYSENPDKVGGRSLDQIRTQIGEYLRRERTKEAAEKLEARLYTEKKVMVNLQPFRIPFASTNAATMGSESAPVTLVEFADFQCPYCAQFHPTLKQLHQKYGDKLRIVYRQFPITSIHPNAFKAAEASLCAKDQGKFWEMHDVMFSEPQKLTVAELKEKASRIGLNQNTFNSCMETGKFVEQVQNDVREGNKAGVTGTPALFVNGVYVEGGAASLETVSSLIDKELARTKR